MSDYVNDVNLYALKDKRDFTNKVEEKAGLSISI